MKVLSIFAFLLLLGACGTIDPMRVPQANEYNNRPEGYVSRTYLNGYDHISAAFNNLAMVKGKSTAPSNAILRVSWDVITGYYEIRRVNCQVHIKNEFETKFTRYPCLDISRTDAGIVVAFEVKTPTGVTIEEYDLSHIRGGFIRGDWYEAPVNSHMTRYRDYSGVPKSVVWSTHE